MPGYIIHLAEAKLISDYVLENQMGQSLSNDFKEKWRSLFYLGALMPDAVSKLNKDKSHFRNPLDKGKIVTAPDLKRFLMLYHPMWKQPALCGYYAHLYLDCCFFTEYLNQCVEFYNHNGDSTDKISDCEIAFIKKSGIKILAKDFFSEEWFYGDYTKLNWYVIQKYSVALPKRMEDTEYPVKEAFDADLGKVLEQLDVFLKNSQVETTTLKVFFDNTIEGFLEQKAREFVEVMKNGGF